ncbi:MAG: SDR family oxidoreductase [Gammaproteobacteria bacterium]|jgi:NAD(P)-dependent dehydrogenase (short-subunit alcohol dehydrogenase family)|nr:SDR family oxidoreductase [Gammaproteobacteria bacterium]MCH1549966.1 SDR family oxidoreductase [Pseudomonadales bacterium]
MDKLLDFTGRVALVTGGSRGLGRQMALALAERGANVVVTSRKAEACAEVAAEIEAMGRQAMAYGCHVGHWDEIDGLVEAAYSRFGRIDVLINNAGMSPLYPKLTDISEALFDKVMGVNLKGPFRLMAVVGERMAAGQGGSIINISSTASLNPSPTSEPYGAAKAGLNALTRSFAFAYGPNVRVNCIVAGPFLTDISKAWDMAAFEANAKANLAVERGGEPEEIVGAALYLASDSSKFTTGTTIRVDGGTR